MVILYLSVLLKKHGFILVTCDINNIIEVCYVCENSVNVFISLFRCLSLS